MSNSPLPKVSVCLLTYNRANALKVTLESLLGQSHADFELIINDNQSQDNTEQVCREFERLDSRVQYYKNPTNLFFTGNQNAAILRANTDYVALVHDGDIYRSDLLEKWTRALVAEPTAALVFNALEYMDESGQVAGSYRHPYAQLTRGIDLFDEMIRRPDSPIFGIVMVRKHCVLSVGPFDPRIPMIADVDMWMRLLLQYDAAYVPECLIKIAPHGTEHPTNGWKARREHELIYVLNSARRYRGQPRQVARLRRQIAPVLWKLRLRTLLFGVRHGRLSAVAEGLEFMARWRNFAAEEPPDSVLDWHSAAKQTSGDLSTHKGLGPAAAEHDATLVSSRIGHT